MSSKFIFDIKIPVVPYDDRDYNEHEGSQICEQRNLQFSRTWSANYASSNSQYWTSTNSYDLDETPFYIHCIVEIQGRSVLSQLSELGVLYILITFCHTIYTDSQL